MLIILILFFYKHCMASTCQILFVTNLIFLNSIHIYQSQKLRRGKERRKNCMFTTTRNQFVSSFCFQAFLARLCKPNATDVPKNKSKTWMW